MTIRENDCDCVAETICFSYLLNQLVTQICFRTGLIL